MIFSEFIRGDHLCKEQCSEDVVDTCDKGEICMIGECQSGCANNDDCKRGEICYRRGCVDSCLSKESVCPKGRYCHIDDKACLLPCRFDQDCARGYKCSKGGQCLKPCSENSHCSNNEQYCNR